MLRLVAFLAFAILLIASHQARDCSGIFHLTGTGDTNWSGFARHIFDLSEAAGGPSAEVHDIATSEYPTKARRPAYSRLDTAKFAADFGLKLPDWREGLRQVVAELAEAKR